MPKQKRKVYIIVKEQDIACFSNLTKAVHNTPTLTYSPLYLALKEKDRVVRNGITVIKTVLQ